MLLGCDHLQDVERPVFGGLTFFATPPPVPPRHIQRWLKRTVLDARRFSLRVLVLTPLVVLPYQLVYALARVRKHYFRWAHLAVVALSREI